MASKRALLSIDGGGIRGILPICALVELERQLNLQARQLFSFIAGTSTGAIITAALASGMPAADVLKLYQRLGPSMFVRDWGLFARSLGSYKYSTVPLRKMLSEFVGDVTLNELPVEVLITATRVSDASQWYFVRDNEINAGATGRLKLVDCVTASSAAPTFFEPYYVPTIGTCVDGGVGVAGNPVYQACVEAFDYSEGYVIADTRVVSLGCGFVKGGKNIPGNLVQWIRWTIGELLDAPSQQQTQLVGRHFKVAANVRINPQLPYPIELDSISAIPELIRMGQSYAEQVDWRSIFGDLPA